MTLAGAVRACLILGLAGFALALPAIDVGARPKEPVLITPPPPPPMPNVAVGERMLEDAAAYESYMRQASLISPNFTDAGGVAQSLRQGVAYEPGQFMRGEIVYAAVAALQDPAFVAAVRQAGATPEGRYEVVAKIFANPLNAFRFNGAAGAAGRAKAAIVGEGMQLFNAGRLVTQAAYDVQHQAWSHADVEGRDARLETVRTISASQRYATPDQVLDLKRQVAGGGASTIPAPPAAQPPYSPLIVHAVALAALAAIGQAGDDQAFRLSWLTDDYFTDHCLIHAKNELKECLAVAKPNYEDVFCLGKQAMAYTGACTVQGAWSAVPLEITTHALRL
ncbi:MAG: hypothetical protein ACHP7N_13395, partial [Caulobacterales bacterium]